MLQEPASRINPTTQCARQLKNKKISIVTDKSVDWLAGWLIDRLVILDVYTDVVNSDGGICEGETQVPKLRGRGRGYNGFSWAGLA